MTRDERWLLEEKYAGVPTPIYEADKVRLAEGEPLGYVIGYQPFLGLKIYLDSRPLIPRVETEWWAAQLLTCADAKHTKVLDLCAGSGAIGCATLAQLPHTHVSFGEIDPVHEATIRRNIRDNNLDVSRTDIRIGDLFDPFAGETFDIIVANPPYIPSTRTLDPSVADHEPVLALFAGEDGLSVIRRIANELAEHLAPGGEAWMEVDSEHAESARALFATRGFATEIRTDQYDRPRVLVVSFS